MGLPSIEGVKKVPGAVTEFVKNEAKTAHNHDWTCFSSLIGWAHGKVMAELPRDEEGKVRKLATIGTVVMKIAYAILAYPIGVPAATIGGIVGEVTRGVASLKNFVVDNTKKIWNKIFGEKASVPEADKPVRTGRFSSVRRRHSSNKG